MPYIPPEDRAGFEYIIQALSAALTNDEPFAGRLNYVISSVLAHNRSEIMRLQKHCDLENMLDEPHQPSLLEIKLSEDKHDR